MEDGINDSRSIYVDIGEFQIIYLYQKLLVMIEFLVNHKKLSKHVFILMVRFSKNYLHRSFV